MRKDPWVGLLGPKARSPVPHHSPQLFSRTLLRLLVEQLRTRHFASKPWWVGGLLLTAAFVVGCASSDATRDSGPTGDSSPPRAQSSDTTAGAYTSQDVEESRPEPVKMLRLSGVRERIEEVADDWLGVPYEWGGTSKQGIDCSALVQTLFRDAFNRRLPRVTELQVQAGSTVTQTELRPGDLVFFRPDDQYNHVGLYLGDKTFVHASSSDGVTKAPIDTDYWQRHYWTSRRVLSPSKVPDSLASELIAYRHPEASRRASTSSGRGEADGEGVPADSTRQTPDGAVRQDTVSIASCGDPGVECDSQDRGTAQDSTVATADTTERKGW